MSNIVLMSKNIININIYLLQPIAKGELGQG